MTFEVIKESATAILLVITCLFVLFLFISAILGMKTFTVKSSNFTSPEKELQKYQAIEIPELDMNKAPFNNKESFNNDLPNEKVSLIRSDIDYSDVAAEMALEKTIIDQHKSYVNEKNKVTNTASFLPSRSDSQDDIPWVGLRRPKYTSNNTDLVEDSARVIPTSVSADQLAKPVELSWK